MPLPPPASPPASPRVLIAGGGPVGMAVALALARYGVRSVIAEADAGVCTGSRAICLSRRTLEILARLGVEKPFLAKGLPWTGGRSFYRDRPVLHFTMPHDDDQRFPPMVNLQQYYVEQFLADAIAAQPDLIALRWSTRVTDLVQGDHAIRATLATDPGPDPGTDQGTGQRTEVIEADYAVACDGARSQVRQALGLSLTGTAYEGRYVIVDIEAPFDLPTERLAWFDPPSAPGRTVLMHKQPDDTWRLDYQLHAHEDAEQMIRPENVLPVVDAHLRMMGLHQPYRTIWISTYRALAVSLDRYRHGRVLFAGDAAHLVPIFGVRGLNSGFDDAFNLGWKLAAVLDGQVLGRRAADTLLDSYDTERRHAWGVNVAHAMRSTEFMAPPSRGFELMRAAALSLAGAHPALAALINPRQSSAIRYADSPLNVPDPFEGQPGPAVGGIIPETRLEDDAGTPAFLSEALPDGFSVLLFHEGGALPAAAVRACRRLGGVVPVTVLAIRPGGTAAPPPVPGLPVRDLVDRLGRARILFAAPPNAMFLLRPDGHVCARWRDPDAVRAGTIERALGAVLPQAAA